MNATDDRESASATLRATVDLPDPEPPAIPITSGLAGASSFDVTLAPVCDVREPEAEREADAPSRLCIGAAAPTGGMSALEGTGSLAIDESLPAGAGLVNHAPRDATSFQSSRTVQYLSAMSRTLIRIGRGLGLVLLGTGLISCAPVRQTASSGETTDLVIAATTDVHGRMTGWDYYAGTPDSARGLARVATIVDSVRAANPDRVVVVDAGDFLQGNPLAFLAARVDTTRPNPIVAAMNVIRYDAVAIGNHEFDYGLAMLGRAIQQASFPFLAANAFHANGTRAYPAYTIVERGGVRVGIVGATNPGVMIWSRENLRGRVVIRDIVPEVRRAVEEARSRGADVIVVTAHSGLDDRSSYDTITTGASSENVAARIAREVPGIDLLVFGHSHQEHADTVIGSTRVLQPRNWASSVGVARLTLERSQGAWRVARSTGAVVRSVGHAEHPGVIRAVAPSHASTIAYVNRAVGTTPVAWRADSSRVRDTPLLDFINEVQRRTAGAELSATPSFSLDASLDAGPITVAELARLYPYDNTLRAIRISGRQLRQYIEHSARYYVQWSGASSAPIVDPQVPGYSFDIVAGADYTVDVSRPVGSRVTSLEVKGKPVAETDTFTLALNNYRQSGGGGFDMLVGAPVAYDQQLEVRQLLIDEVARRRTITHADYFQQNWRLEPADAAAAAYVAMRRDSTERIGGPGRAAARGAANVPRPNPTPLPSPSARTLRIISTNDFHGAFESRADSAGIRRGGAAHVAAVIARARAECATRTNCESVLLDGGDMFQGSAPSNRTFGATVVELYNRLRYTAAALGNHEWDWGRDSLRARMREARFPILAANVRFADGRDVPWIPDDTLLTVGPLKVGVIGITTIETPRVTMAINVADLRFPEPAPIVNERARALRARGADAVVVVAHSGAFCRGSTGTPSCDGEIVALARGITERVDAIVSGHTHSIVETRVNGIPIVQARSHGRAVGIIDVPLGGGEPTVAIQSVTADSSGTDLAIDSLVRRVVAAVAAEMARPIVQVAEPLRRSGREYALGQLIADAQRAAGKADVAVMNNGGIRADLPAGQATYGSLFEIQPFANSLYRVTVRGRDLRAYIEKLVERESSPGVHVSGISVVYAPAKPAGARVVSVTMANGQPLRDDGTYTLVMSNFMLGGGDGLGLGTAAIKTEPLEISDIDALVTHVRAQRQPLRAPFQPRFVAALP
jgi:2',3'-cyclic-nucleotide 2'-phosphodiesterase (5'-nucleotidase family)